MVNILCAFNVDASEIPCEKFEEVFNSNTLKKCLMTEETTIGNEDFTVAPKDELVAIISLAYNKKIAFLPQNISDCFPNLRNYDAAACAIEKIKKSNFANLVHLSTVNLDGNLIQSIHADVFSGLSSLQSIFLSKNWSNNRQLWHFPLSIPRLQSNQIHPRRCFYRFIESPTSRLVQQYLH